MKTDQPTIENLTSAQKTLCDILWACKTPQQMRSFINSLPSGTREQADSLAQIMILECLEPFIEQFDEDAKSVLDQVRG